MSLKRILIISPLVLAQIWSDVERSEHAPEDPSFDNPLVAEAVAEVRPPDNRYVHLFTGSPPTNDTDSDSGLLLAIVTINKTSFGPGSAGVATDAPITNSGTAGHFRIKNAAGRTIVQGKVTSTGGGGDVTFDNPVCVAGGTVVISSSPLVSLL